ncbi:unnamed protein product [Rotaria magnacalcarata]|uniref:Uncharacterized protein n=1 Tax=Rotaria magnacalcarata TaxID=392030 RepID=A0A816P5L7_9BILA|nr:unnamed protein product [Rotaria magnacalcarata]
MAGIYRGCQAFIKKNCSDAKYYHCSNHCLKLALIDSFSISQIYKFRCGTLKSPTAEQLYHAIDNFQHVTSTSISCLVLSEIVSVSRMLQTETLDFSPANRYVDDLLDKLEQQKYDAQDYFHNVVYRHVDQFII